MLREMLKMLKLSKVSATATVTKGLGYSGLKPWTFEYSRSIASLTRRTKPGRHYSSELSKIRKWMIC